MLKDILDILGAATPFLLLFLGWWYNHQQKKEKKAEEDKKQLKELQDKTITDDLNKAIESLNKATSETIDFKKTVESLRSDFETMAVMNRLNGQYTHELAQLVMVLAEGLRDQHLDGNITRAVEKYRRFEADALGSIVTGEFPLMNHHDK